jgi:SAM-dependent methyltransferase
MAWFEQWFADELYMRLYAHRDGGEAGRAIDLFQNVTGLQPDTAPLLDLACGAGRHAFELARRGYRIFAADLSAPLLREAQRRTRRYASSILLLRSDMRLLPFEGAIPAVLQLFTAFGYFDDDVENWSVLDQVRRSLAPDGWYMLDFLNAGELRQSLTPLTLSEIDGMTVLQRRRIVGNRVEKRILIRDGERAREYTESVRLFTLEDFQRMLPVHGFSLYKVFGHYDGRPYTAVSPRCLIFARAI